MRVTLWLIILLGLPKGCFPEDFWAWITTPFLSSWKMNISVGTDYNQEPLLHFFARISNGASGQPLVSSPMTSFTVGYMAANRATCYEHPLSFGFSAGLIYTHAWFHLLVAPETWPYSTRLKCAQSPSEERNHFLSLPVEIKAINICSQGRMEVQKIAMCWELTGLCF